ncbi:MAG: leucine-rich repeat domain-containing protein, partial [Bacteroidaceae bacterium]|nr:leucine-rich repeat domain-containing protein [Bacteroidaceae bacterium]
MKNYFLKHLLATLLLLCATAASAYDFEVDGIYYTFLSKEDKSVEVTRPSYSRNEYYGSIVIPESVTFDGVTYSVTSIGGSAFYGCPDLTSIEIPNSVTSIGYSAFRDCTGLTSIEIPNSVTSIGENAFYNCTGLTSIEIPEGVIIINSGAFMNCTALTSVTIPKSLKVMHGAFPGCYNITTVNISDLAAYCNIEMLGDNFVGHDFVDMSSYIGSPLFNFVSSTSNDIYGGYTHTYSAPKDLVLNGEKIVNLVIPADVDRITGHFLGCSAESISFEERDAENSRLTITSYSFAGMTNLKKVTLPDFDVRLGGSTFIGCTSLEEITIGRDYQWAYDSQNLFEGMCIIEFEIFQGCTHLRKLTAKEGVTRIPDMFGPQFTFEKDYFFNHFMHYDILPIDTLVIPDLEITTCIQPQTIDYLNEAAWYGSSLDQRYDCNVLVAGEPVKEKSGELIIPQGTKRIFGGKISGMNITKVTLPSSITHIYGGAFEDCTKLSRINIPESVTYIGKDAFDNTAIYNNCNEKLLYIDNWLVAYKSDNLGNIKIKEGTKGIADRLFAANTTLTGIELPNSITRI